MPPAHGAALGEKEVALARQQHFSIEASPDDAQTRLAILDLPRRKTVRKRGVLGRLAGMFGKSRG